MDVENLLQSLETLEQERLKLLANPDNLAPQGAWIHEYTVPKKRRDGTIYATYRYAKWQALEPIFLRNPTRSQKELDQDLKHWGIEPKALTKHQHIGRVGGKAADIAYEKWDNRKRLEAITLALLKIEAIITELCHK